MTEDQLEQETLGWLQDVGYTLLNGPEIAVDGLMPERADYVQTYLPNRLRDAVNRLNPAIPAVARALGSVTPARYRAIIDAIPARRYVAAIAFNLFLSISSPLDLLVLSS